MNCSLIDTHAHLDMEPFDYDREPVIARALDVGVNRIITVGIDLASSRKAVALAAHYPQIYATAGIHPHEAATVSKENVDTLAQIARESKVVAIGEMGLDYFRNLSPKEAQWQVLNWQLELADELQLPVIIHCRQADRDMLKILSNWKSARSQIGKSPGVIHCFSGNIETAQEYLDMGFYISFGAYIGYPSATNVHTTVKHIPPERMMVETDSPFLPPQKFRGKRNEPSYVSITAGIIAEIRQVPLATIAQETTSNAEHLFGLQRT